MDDANPDTRELARLLRRLDDRQQLGELLSRYGVAVDDRDFDGIAALFTHDAEFNGVKGRREIIDYYRLRTSEFTTSTHSALNWHFDFESDDLARGVVSGAAELCIGGKAIRISLRYLDRYRRQPSGWAFAQRVVKFRYVLPFDAVADGLDDPQRVRWPGRPPQLADLPDTLQTYVDSRRSLAGAAPVPRG